MTWRHKPKGRCLAAVFGFNNCEDKRRAGQKQSRMEGVQNGGEILWKIPQISVINKKLNKSCNIVTTLGSVVNLEINIFNLQSLKGSFNST